MLYSCPVFQLRLWACPGAVRALFPAEGERIVNRKYKTVGEAAAAAETNGTCKLQWDLEESWKEGSRVMDKDQQAAWQRHNIT